MTLQKFTYALCLLCVTSGCSTAIARLPLPPAAETPAPHVAPATIMRTSFYGKGDNFHGRRTANGEKFHSGQFTAAHKTLPFGTRVRLTNPANGRSIVVRINDRGPFTNGRDLDVSWAAARELDFVKQGVTELEVEILPLNKSLENRVE